MPRLLFAAALLALAPAAARAQDDDEGVKARAGRFKVEERDYFTRLVFTGTDTLFGTQINRHYLHRADAPITLAVLTHWDAAAAVGLLGRWNPRHEPLTYYHRTGPVGALFYHLRTRNGGADAAAPVGVLGLYAGTPAAYALPRQSFTFYSAHRELKGLIEDTDRHFTYVHDARRRGATVAVKYGPVRPALAADRDRKYAALLVELVEESFDPGDRLTLEAVRLYRDRVTPDGIVALHASNRVYNIMPAIERIARELKLAGRVWHDDSENRPGKTASSWVLLARSDADLGPLARPALEQVMEFGTRNEPLGFLLAKYGPDALAQGAILREWGGPEPETLTTTLMSIRHGPQAAILLQHVNRLRDAGEQDATLRRVADVVCGRMFAPLVSDPRTELRTDAHMPPLEMFPPRKK
jgi:hypothetical protein